MSTTIVGFLIAFSVFAFLQIVIRLIFGLQDFLEQTSSDLALEGEQRATSGLRWLFVYTRFLLSCLFGLARTRFSKGISKLTRLTKRTRNVRAAKIGNGCQKHQ